VNEAYGIQPELDVNPREAITNGDVYSPRDLKTIMLRATRLKQKVEEDESFIDFNTLSVELPPKMKLSLEENVDEGSRYYAEVRKRV